MRHNPPPQVPKPDCPPPAQRAPEQRMIGIREYYFEALKLFHARYGFKPTHIYLTAEDEAALSQIARVEGSDVPVGQGDLRRYPTLLGMTPIWDATHFGLSRV